MVENPPFNVGGTRDVGSIPGLGRFLGVGNGILIKYTCLENPVGRGAWEATVNGGHQFCSLALYLYVSDRLVMFPGLGEVAFYRRHPTHPSNVLLSSHQSYML